MPFSNTEEVAKFLQHHSDYKLAFAFYTVKSFLEKNELMAKVLENEERHILIANRSEAQQRLCSGEKFINSAPGALFTCGQIGVSAVATVHCRKISSKHRIDWKKF